MTTLINRRLARSIGAALLVCGSAAPVGAQAAVADARWEPWIGCWQPTVAGGGGSLVCVAPTRTPSVVELVTVEKNAIVARDTIDASGTQLQVNKEGCKGWQSGTFSADSRRVYLRSELNCGGVKRGGTGLLAISPAGEWLEVQGVTAGGNTGVRAIHYSDIGISRATVPSELASLNNGRALVASTARAAASGTLAVTDILEAVKAVDTAVVQAWLVERGAKFQLSAKQLVALADAGVPASVTDVMIGMSYPDHFALQQRAAGPLYAGGAFTQSDSARLATQYLANRCSSGYNSFVYSVGLVDPCAVLYAQRNGYGYGLGYGYSAYGSSLYGYSPYGYGYGGGYYGGGYYSGYYSAPVVVVKGDPEPHGRVVNGRGYSRGDDGTRTGTAATGSTAPVSSGSTSTAGGSSSSGSSSGGDGGRTAHPRPPT